MGGIYTQERVLKDFPKAQIWLHNFGNPATEAEMTVAQCVPTQTTTSYRTRGVDRVTGSDEALALVRQLNVDTFANKNQFDTGHPFDTTKQTWDLSHELVDIEGGSARYRGPLIPRNSAEFPVTSFFPSMPSFDSTFYGTKAINGTIPNKPVADMANALGELRTVGGIPKAMGSILDFSSRAAFARSAGKEYLNAVFGWAPLVKDIESIMLAVLKSQKITEDYLAGSGKETHRNYYFPPIYENLSIKEDVVVTNQFAGFSSNDTQLFTGPGVDGRSSQITNHDRKIWFSGAYTYLLEQGIDPYSNMNLYASLARKVLGARLMPEVLWELRPWSWLIDWFFGIDSILENIEAFQTDGLVLKYGYIMCTDVVRTETVAYRHGLMHMFGPITRTATVVRKQRVKATPYGFGLDPTTWSPERWAILAALGLTKAPRFLG